MTKDKNINNTINNISSIECFNLLSSQRRTHLVDVRTKPEWNFVGIPDLSSINKKVIFVSWQIYPEMTVNDVFENQILETKINTDDTLFFICRSGQRSYDAAEFLISRGFTYCFNVFDGFEGKLNQHHKRALIDGWQFNNLPWKQQ